MAIFLNGQGKLGPPHPDPQVGLEDLLPCHLEESADKILWAVEEKGTSPCDF